MKNNNLASRWWMSFPKIESRRCIDAPFGVAPVYKIDDVVRLKEKPMRVRKVLGVEWHRHRYQWVYVIETSASDSGFLFEPYWFADKLEAVRPEHPGLL